MRMYAATHRIIEADHGKVLTDGETYVKTVILPIDAEYMIWREITEAEAQEAIARMESDAE